MKEAVVQHYFEKGRGQITSSVFSQMVKIILMELPDEDPHTWYNPSVKNQAANGLLYTRYRYLLQHDRRYRKDNPTAKLSSSMHLETVASTWEHMTEAERDTCYCKLHH